MDDNELEKLFGDDFCRYLTHEFIRKTIRLNLNSEEFFGEILNSVMSCDDLETKIVLPSFWQKRLDDLNSKFKVEGQIIKHSETWLTIAKHFYVTLINVGQHNLQPQIESKLKKVLDFNLAEKNCRSAAELFTQLEQAYQESAHTELPLLDQDGNAVDSTSGVQNISEISVFQQMDQFVIDNPIQFQNDSTSPLNGEQKSYQEPTPPHVDTLSLSENGHIELIEVVNEGEHESLCDMNKCCQSTNDIESTTDKPPNEEETNDDAVGDLSFDSQTTEICSGSADNTSVRDNVADDNDSNVNLDILDSSIENIIPSNGSENHDLNEISNSRGEPKQLFSNEPLNLNVIPDSMDLRSRYWLKKRPIAVAFSEDNISQVDPHDAQAKNELNELNLILGQHASLGKRSRFKGKKIQLRAKNQDKEIEVEIEDLINDNTDDASTVSDGTNLIISHLCTQADYQRLFKNKAKHAYTMDEDHNILKFIIKTDRYAEIKGNQMWIEMEKQNVNFGRSWQSMKERFRKSIFPNLSLYVDMCRLDEEAVQLLQDNFNYVPSSTTAKARLAKKNSSTVDTTSNDASNVLGNNYSIEEDEEIVKFIFNHDIGDLYFRGRKIWIKAEKHFARVFSGRNRTWQSLKERFIKRICPQLYKYKNVSNYSKALGIVEKCCSLDNKNDIKKHLKHRFNKN